MITAILAVIFYAIDPLLGVIVAIVMPSIVALDSNGDYAEVIVFFMFSLAMYFVRKQMTGIDEE